MLGANSLRSSCWTMASGAGAEAAAVTLGVSLFAASKCIPHLSRKVVNKLGRDIQGPCEESREIEPENQVQPRRINKKPKTGFSGNPSLKCGVVNGMGLVIIKEQVGLCFSWYLTINQISQRSPSTGGNEQQAYQHAEINYLGGTSEELESQPSTKALKFLLFLSL